jgi:hypothetical protein
MKLILSGSMRNPTRHKLDEAKYFLNKVKSAYARYTRDANQEKINIIHYNRTYAVDTFNNE